MTRWIFHSFLSLPFLVKRATLWTIGSDGLNEPRNDPLGLAIGLRRMGKAARSTACHASSQVGRGKFLSGKFLHGCTICQPEVAQVLFSFVWFVVFRYFFNGVLPEFIAKQPTSNGK